ncbi:hypothetical protein [Aureibacillus halotolerans]|uniref:hypothetical protein n=1 Tax=Aureibacillus halotolerans TaxID=1508390 RepID=UPI00105D8016|nr:hypothetical protein [Aureibacillus halotolerans]
MLVRRDLSSCRSPFVTVQYVQDTLQKRLEFFKESTLNNERLLCGYVDIEASKKTIQVVLLDETIDRDFIEDTLRQLGLQFAPDRDKDALHFSLTLLSWKEQEEMI